MDDPGPERFRRVFADGVGFTVEGSTVRVAASTRAAIGLIERRFGAAVREAAHAVVGAGATVEFVVAEQAGPAAGAPVVAVAAAALATPSQGHRSSRAAVAGQSGGRGRVNTRPG